ncbi:hypothetical protein WN944_009934 [Citrus x changshan-huyou]|uniref:Uncharacterized protein n=1 Tax=Citrus x changshan-huyou TaxID=2935761 RepID=A0AAP0MVG9_9ROSI
MNTAAKIRVGRISDQFCPGTDRAIKCIGRHFIGEWQRGWAPFDDDLVAVMKYLKSEVGGVLIIMRVCEKLKCRLKR